MPRFRPVDPRLAGLPVTLDAVRRLAAEVIAPPHFFVAPDLDLEWSHLDREETSWEVFRGRLLDPAHTRERAVFEAWSVYEKTPEGRSSEPVLSLKLDAAAGVLYVVRGLECYVWEGYDAGGGVILSRERRKWVRELVAALRLDQFADLDELRDEMICGLYHAVVGTSRLPLTSVEAPLPAFSFGRLFYCFREDVPEGSGPLRAGRELLRDMLLSSFARIRSDDIMQTLIGLSLARREHAHLLETFLHSVRFEEMSTAAEEFMAAWGRQGVLGSVSHLFKELFNGVSLSPWTDLTDKLLAFIREMNPIGPVRDPIRVFNGIDFLGYMLRQISRHLTSYDLVTFHHRGANYPDALLLDAVLKEYLACAERFPGHFLDEENDDKFDREANPLRRRALRQAWLTRRRYEGHAVPDLPTSPGENNRVLPPSHPRVPEEQVLQTARRTRHLYDGDPLPKYLGPRAAEALRRSIADLSDPVELQELGVGIFLDRPLAADKLPGEADASPLFASIAFSRSIAVQRIHALAREELFAGQKPLLEECLRRLLDSPPRGLPLDRIGGASRPGAVSLTDARLASPDFEFLGTTGAAIRALNLFDSHPVSSKLPPIEGGLIVRNPSGTGLLIFDEKRQLREEMEIDKTRGYVRRAGVEYPAAGLLVTRVWEEMEDGSLREHDLRAAPIRLPPR